MAKRFQPLEPDNGIEIKADKSGISGRFRIRGWKWWTFLMAALSGWFLLLAKFGVLLKEWVESWPK